MPKQRPTEQDGMDGIKRLVQRHKDEVRKIEERGSLTKPQKRRVRNLKGSAAPQNSRQHEFKTFHKRTFKKWNSPELMVLLTITLGQKVLTVGKKSQDEIICQIQNIKLPKLVKSLVLDELCDKTLRISSGDDDQHEESQARPCSESASQRDRSIQASEGDSQRDLRVSGSPVASSIGVIATNANKHEQIAGKFLLV